MRTRTPKTKSFNGCWTCRRRKVKCPGPRPECSRCAQAGLSCDGFETKLCWSPDSLIRTSGASSRQRMILPRGVNVLKSYNVREADRMLDELERDSIPPGCDVRIGPFSVFREHMTGRQTGATHPKEADEDKSEVQSPLQLLDPQHDVGEISSSQYEASRTIVPNVDDYTNSSHELVALSHSSCSITRQSFEFSSFWMEKLLSHYILRVADILQPVYHPQNPFRSIHAQYAIVSSTKPLFDQSHGAGSESISHRVIFHSILSTAAFHLRGRSDARHPAWEFYDNLGRCLRLQALKDLQQAIAEPSLDEEAHCARLSAILTLVTSDLVEGSSSEFVTHLLGCYQVRQLYLSTTTASGTHCSRTRQLDTSSFFLTTIAQTTAHHLPELWHFPPYSSETLFDTPFTAADTCLEHTYGITSSMASIIFLINKYWHYARSITFTDESCSDFLNTAIATLIAKLNCWTANSELFTSVAADDTATLSLARHLATSFYYSTQIYFRCCFDPGPLYDQLDLLYLSSQTLLALERAELEKLSASRAGASISWPALVAACVAPEELRIRWTKYWNKLLSYQIGHMQATWEVVQEVWMKVDSEAINGTSGQSSAPKLPDSGSYQTLEPTWISIIKIKDTAILAI